MYSADQRMRQRTAHKSNVLQCGETNVGHELSAAAHQAIVFLARQPGADALAGARSAGGGKITLIAHDGVLLDRTDADLLTPQLPVAELTLLHRIGYRRGDRTRVGEDVRQSLRCCR